VTENHLTINITGAEVAEIEAQAEPCRQRVREMYSKYRPGLVEGNGQKEKVVDVSSEPVTEPSVPEPAIVRKEGQEKSAAFWAQFCGDPERAVEKSTAIFVAKAITDQTVGRGISNQAIVAFGKSETITVADVLAVIEKLCGGPAGWQLLQKKAGIQPGRGA
jgi:hypothetical protein